MTCKRCNWGIKWGWTHALDGNEERIWEQCPIITRADLFIDSGVNYRKEMWISVNMNKETSMDPRNGAYKLGL